MDGDFGLAVAHSETRVAHVHGPTSTKSKRKNATLLETILVSLLCGLVPANGRVFQLLQRTQSMIQGASFVARGMGQDFFRTFKNGLACVRDPIEAHGII